jgi:putative transposase
MSTRAGGAPKIREKLRRLYPEQLCPAISTVHAVLDRHNLVKRRRRRRYRAEGTPLSRPLEPNDLWCADYKGEFMITDKRYCHPLTVTDSASRYLLGCEALATTRGLFARQVFDGIFRDFGLPRAIRTEWRAVRRPQWLVRTQPFVSLVAAPGIQIERIKPGSPQQNGRHERMDLTLKQEATKPASANFVQQRGRFDRFVDIYNAKAASRRFSNWGRSRK